MKNYFIFFLTIILLSSCIEPNNKYQKYNNIVIISDMSSRLVNKPLKDIEEINVLIQFFINECVKPGEKIGDKSSLSFYTFSDKVVAQVDIGKIKNLGEKQQFINSTGKYLNNGLRSEIENFKRKVSYAYANRRNQGLDLISVLIDKIENEQIVKKNTFLIDGIDTTFITYETNIYIFTDGYLEYINKTMNSQFYFGDFEINKIRKLCITNNINITRALEINNSLGLPPNKYIKNKFINLHVLETHERDKNDRLQTYKYPKGQRDNEILEAVWRKWAKESGFKSFEWKKY
jgi:hypothetical protein